MSKNSFLTWEIICFVLMIWCSCSAVRLAYKVIRSRKMLRVLRAENAAVVHGISMHYKAAAYLFVIIPELIALIYFGTYSLPVCIRSGFGLLALVIGVLSASFLVTLVIHLIALFQEKHVYLTKNGLITYVDCHTFSSCRFAWENSGSGLSDMLHVYVKKDRMPFTARFDSDIAAAHALTEQYASGGESASETEYNTKE